jgi:hypothetical protein
VFFKALAEKKAPGTRKTSAISTNHILADGFNHWENGHPTNENVLGIADKKESRFSREG